MSAICQTPTHTHLHNSARNLNQQHRGRRGVGSPIMGGAVVVIDPPHKFVTIFLVWGKPTKQICHIIFTISVLVTLSVFTEGTICLAVSNYPCSLASTRFAPSVSATFLNSLPIQLILLDVESLCSLRSLS